MLPTDQFVDSPSIPGLAFRTFRGSEDFAAMVRVQQARATADQIDPLSSYESIPTWESIAREYTDITKFDPQRNMLFAEIGDQVIGYTTTEWWTEQDGTWLYLHEEFVVPDWRGRGIEQAMLKWMEQRLRAVAAGHPTQGKAVLGANATTAEQARRQLLLREDYQEVFSMLEMEFTAWDQLPHTPVPAGFVVKHAEPEQYRALWDALQAAYHGRSMFMTATEEDYEAFEHDPTHDPSLELVAWDNDQIAGMVFVRMDRGHGVIDECNVGHAYRRRGLAKALMVQGLRLLEARGASMVRLHVRKHNETGAQQLYERLGFRVLKEFGRFRKPLPTN